MKKETEFIRFVENMFHIYLEKRDFNAFLELLHDDISWYGMGEKEVCRNKNEAKTLLEIEKQSWDGHFKIIEQKYKAVLTGDGCCIVYGSLQIKDAGFSAILLEVNSRVSLVCKKDDVTGKIKLLHSHVSVPAQDRKQDSFANEVIEKSYSDMLIKALEERTKTLRETTQEMSALVSNIRGGVQICAYGNEMHNIYTNDGYYNICGFTREEVRERFHDNHFEMIHPDYRDEVSISIKKQTSIGNDFVLEYPLIHKTNDIVWVIDKGCLLTDEAGVKRFQCVLTDITDMRSLLAETNSLKNYYHSILNSLPTPLVIKNNDYTISFINYAAIDAMGLKCSASELVGKECRTLNLNICGTDACPQKMLKRGNNVTRFKNNNREYSITTVPLVDNGIRVGFVEAMQDETIQMMNRKMLIQKNEELMVADVRYKLAMEQVNIYMFDYVVATRQLVMSDSAAQKFGGQKVYENVPVGLINELSLNKYHSGLVAECFDKINKGESVVCLTLPLLDKDGVETMQQITMTNIYSDMGEPIRAIGIMMDVTEIGKLETQRQYREAITADNFLTYEVNVTRDRVLDCSTTLNESYGDIYNMPWSKVMQMAAKRSVYVDDRKRYLKACAVSTIINNFKKGINTSKLEYRRLNNKGEVIWAESTFTTIQDKSSGDIKMFCQVKDITNRKEQEIRAQDEQMFYEAIIANSSTVYEINVTKNQFIKGHENWEAQFSIKIDNYSDMIDRFAESVVLPADREEFLRVFRYENVLAAHARGDKEVYCEYRRPKDGSGDYIWVGSTMQFIDDPISGEIRAISRVTDINEKKLWELELLYTSQRDYISGMLNKGTVQRMIEDFVASEEGRKGKHAFIMFDIDNFKDINDNFGHLFGDAVLSEVSRKATAIFRENDMLGRIGGDEFGILMKYIPNSQLAIDKANELCHSVHETYTTAGQKYTVSISVGIAIFSEDGKTYDELYSSADKALYHSKKAGKNAVTIFNKKIMGDANGKGLTETRVRNIESMSVERNMGEYVFRILHESIDKYSTIESVLELVGKHYGFERAYIYEDNAEHTFADNTFRWSLEGVDVCGPDFNKFVYQTVEDYKSKYDKFGVLVVENAERLKGVGAAVTKAQNVRSFVQFAMMRQGEFIGFIGFDACNVDLKYKADQINELKNIADVISVFLLELRATEERARHENISRILLERLHCYAFIVNADTYKVSYTNHIAKEHIGKDVDVPCYKQFYKLDKPCHDCEASKMCRGEMKERISIVTGTDGNQYEAQSVPIQWKEGNCVLVMSTRCM